jgi:SAM domain (Sterile alpha motif)
LAGIGLSQCADAFEVNDVEMDLLKNVDDQMLKDIAVTSASHRLRIRNAIAKPAPTSDTRANSNRAVATPDVAAASGAASSPDVLHSAAGRAQSADPNVPRQGRGG